MFQAIALYAVFFFSFLLVDAFAGGGEGEIIQIDQSNRHLIPGGKEVDAIDGDWILKNDRVIAVIGNAAPGREANQMVPAVQGAVIDFTTLSDNNDNLVAYYPQGYRIDAVSAHRVEVVKGRGDEIILRAIRDATDEVPYASVTEYSLRDGESFLRVKTTHHNSGTEEVAFRGVDQLRLDNGIADASPIGDHNLAFICNKWFYAAYGIYSREGLRVPQKPILKGGRKGGIAVAFSPGENITLKPGERVEMRRRLLYGRDVAALQKSAAQFLPSSLPVTTLKVSDTNKMAVADAFVEVLDRRGGMASFALTDMAGAAEFLLPSGNYRYVITKIGHDTLQHDLVIADQSKTVAAIVKPLTSITFTVRDADRGQRIPVKLEFKGVDGTPDPFLGTDKRAEGAGNLYYAFHEEPFQVPLSPGAYTVAVSHGPEYNMVSGRIQVRRGENKSLSVELKREFSTPRWIIADFHNHTTNSGDNNSEVRSRIINMAAEGIEFAPATEHNRITTYTEEIKRVGLQEHISSCAGVELSGLPGPGAINHQNAFPLTIQEGKQGGGFPGTHADPYVQMKGLYDYDDQKFKFMQQNHPNVPWLYFDKDQDGIVDEGFGTRAITHAMEIGIHMFEILNVTSENAVDKDKESRVFHWLQMLNQGDRIYGTANSDNHVVSSRSGSRFNYVYSQYDEPAKIDAEEIARNASKGHIIMSNGPFIKTDINGKLPGDAVNRNKAGDLQMNIEVYTARRIRVDRVQLLINGRQDKNFNFTRASQPDRFTDGYPQFKYSFQLALDNDAHVIVVATGKERNSGSRKGRYAGVSIAIANPIFVDADGSGFEANKDLLGAPLPVAKQAKNAADEEEDE